MWEVISLVFAITAVVYLSKGLGSLFDPEDQAHRQEIADMNYLPTANDVAREARRAKEMVRGSEFTYEQCEETYNYIDGVWSDYDEATTIITQQHYYTPRAWSAMERAEEDLDQAEDKLHKLCDKF